MTLNTDAGDVRVGFVLVHEQTDETTKTIRYWSCSFTSAERVYDTTQWESLTSALVVQLLCPYLECTLFIIHANQDLLRWALILSNASGALARWCVRLSELNCDIAHRACVQHKAANALSRLSTDGEGKTSVEDYLSVCSVKKTQVTGDDLRYVHFCTRRDARSDLKLLNPTKNLLVGPSEC